MATSLQVFRRHIYPIRVACQIMKFLSMCFPSALCYFPSLRSKYSPQHTLLKHPQSTFSYYGERPSFTPTQPNVGTLQLSTRISKRVLCKFAFVNVFDVHWLQFHSGRWNELQTLLDSDMNISLPPPFRSLTLWHFLLPACLRNADILPQQP
jgi:hypothetical protein